MFEPPASMPTARMTAAAASRIRWYSLSVRVCAGATVIESPVDAHRIEVLNRADDHEVVANIAHHLELIFLPANDRFLDERLMDRARIERAGDGIGELLVIVGNRAARTAERERWPDDDRIAEFVSQINGFGNVGDDGRGGHFEANLPAHVLEEQAVFGDA